MTIWAMSLIPFACKGSSWSLVHGITNAPQRLPCGQGHACPVIPGQIAGNLAPLAVFCSCHERRAPIASAGPVLHAPRLVSLMRRLLKGGDIYVCAYYLAPGSLLFEQLGPVMVATRCRVSIDPK